MNRGGKKTILILLTTNQSIMVIIDSMTDLNETGYPSKTMNIHNL